MLKPFSLIFFVAVMVWLGSIFITTDPQERMDRSCVPVQVTDKAATAAMQLIDTGWGQATHQMFQNLHYGCRFVIWRVFYEDDWNRLKALDDYKRQSTGGPARAASDAQQSEKTGMPKVTRTINQY